MSAIARLFGYAEGIESASAITGNITVVMRTKAGIQYSVTPELTINAADFWIIRLRG